MLILHLLILEIFSQTNYQSGVQFVDCKGPSVVVTFPYQFLEIPQIIITQSQINFLHQVEFRFETKSITIKGFQIICGCPQINQNLQVNVKWHAINDQRIQIIDCFNLDNPKNETFTHNNPNALNGFLTLTSIYYQDEINFIIEIMKITPLDVTVGISNTNNLRQIGYQIILGIDEAFVNLGQYKATSNIQIPFPILQDKFFITPYIGFILTSSDAVNQRQSQDITIDPGKLVYKIDEYPPDGRYSKNVHLRIWVSKFFSTNFQPLRYNKIHIIQQNYLSYVIQSTLQLKYDQESLIFNQNGNYKVLIDKSTQFINVFFQYNCQQDKKKSISIQYCHSCQNIVSTQYTCDYKSYSQSHFQYINTIISIFNDYPENSKFLTVYKKYINKIQLFYLLNVKYILVKKYLFKVKRNNIYSPTFYNIIQNNFSDLYINTYIMNVKRKYFFSPQLKIRKIVLNYVVKSW